MAVHRLDRFTIDPADGEELIARHEALVAAAKDAWGHPARATTTS